MNEFGYSNFDEKYERYYSDENVTKQVEEAKNYLENIFDSSLEQIEYLKLRQIGREIQGDKSMNYEDVNARPMYTELISRFIFDNYGLDISQVDDLTGNDWKNTKDYLQKAREKYLNEY